MATKSKAHMVEVDEPLEVDGHSGLVRLPDGTVATWRGTYTPRQVGKHVFIVTGADGKTTETTVTVKEAVS
ncbi:hypothetical protein [Nocardioides sp. GXZ039]|uniref:hypothetical protein n=1 Tax=Nocardioides sp. GXZ039 TaxID=3136018 RepID=UPI0030F392E9